MSIFENFIINFDRFKSIPHKSIAIENRLEKIENRKVNFLFFFHIEIMNIIILT